MYETDDGGVVCTYGESQAVVFQIAFRDVVFKREEIVVRMAARRRLDDGFIYIQSWWRWLFRVSG